MNPMSRPDERWHRHLLAKGREVAQVLEEILAGKDVRLEDLPIPGNADDDPELRARRFLERIDRGIKSFGTPRFGRCAVCEAPIDPAVLEEAPWTERCARHPE